MHTSLRVTGVLPGLLVSVVRGFSFRGLGDGAGGASAAYPNQLTQAEVMSSKSARVRSGPFRNGEPSRRHSVLYSPMVVSARVRPLFPVRTGTHKG